MGHRSEVTQGDPLGRRAVRAAEQRGVHEQRRELPQLHPLGPALSERRDLLAPALFASEAGNALTQRMRLGQLDLPSAQRALRDLFVAVVIVPADAQLAERALELTQLLSLAVVYDAVYAALAEREGAEFWTADHRFYAAARPILPWVRFVAEAPSPPDAV